MRREPINLLYHFCQQPTSFPTMSRSNLRDAAPFQFLSGRVAGETISPWDRCKFPCAQADSTVDYPTDTEVHQSILPLSGLLITSTIDRFDDDPRVHSSWLGEWIPRGRVEERSIGECHRASFSQSLSFLFTSFSLPSTQLPYLLSHFTRSRATTRQLNAIILVH